MERVTQLDHPEYGGRRLHAAALALAGLTGIVAVVWLMRGDPAWRLGEAIWPDGFRVRAGALPMGMTRGLTWALLAAWLGLGPASVVRVARPWAWGVTLAINVVVLALAGWWLVLLGAVVFYALAFDPRWLPRHVVDEPEVVFYDGGCGLCHRCVRRVAAWDAGGVLYRFAPLEGRTAMRLLTPAQRESLPDSIVVRTEPGRLLTRSAAAAHLLDRLGGWPRVLAWTMRLAPGPVCNFGYNRVAAARHKLFKKPGDACPFASPEMRGRFLP